MSLRFRSVGISIFDINSRNHEDLQYCGFVRHAHRLVACLVAGVHCLTHGFGLDGAAVDRRKAVFHLQGKLNHDGAVLVGPDLAVFVEDFRRGEDLVFYKERVQRVVNIVNAAEAVALFLILVVLADSRNLCHDCGDALVNKRFPCRCFALHCCGRYGL